MQIHIDTLGPEARSLDQLLPGPRVAQELEDARTGFVASGALKLEGRLRVEDRSVHLSGKLLGLIHGPCRRCLTPTPFALDQVFELLIRPAVAARPLGRSGKDRQELGEGETDGSFRLDEADEDVYHGDVLDLWPLVREQLMLALPDTQLCQVACAGLCQICGENLNEAACGCERAIPDPRLAGLKDIKLSG